MTPQTPRSELELLDQRIQTAEAQLERTRLVSPARARVLTEELNRLEGAHVTAGDVVLELASPGAWRAALLVSEHDIHLVRADDPVRVEIPAATTLGTWQARFPARVAFVGADPLAEPVGNGTYRVYANLETDRIDNDHLMRFKRGMTVDAKVITRSARAIDLLVRHLTR